MNISPRSERGNVHCSMFNCHLSSWGPGTLPSPGQLEIVNSAAGASVGDSDNSGKTVSFPGFFHQFDSPSPDRFRNRNFADAVNWQRSGEPEGLFPQWL